MDVVRQLQATRHLAVGVVIAVQQVDRDARVPQPAHLANEEQPGVEVLPVPVVHVACNHHEIDLFVDCLCDQIVEGVPGCGTQALCGRISVQRQASQWAVQVQIRGVDEFHGVQFIIGIGGVVRRVLQVRCRLLQANHLKRYLTLDSKAQQAIN